MSTLKDKRLTIGSLLRTFLGPVSITWLLTLCETALMALVPLLIGFAIDGLMSGNTGPLLHLAAVLAGLIAVGVVRRVYGTRVYGTIRVQLGAALAERSDHEPVSTLNARLGMGRELVDFLEEVVPAVMTSAVQLAVALIVLFAFHPVLSQVAMVAVAAMLLLYGLFHRRFYRLNADHNRHTETQVSVLETRSQDGVLSYLTYLRRVEIKLSDTEACVYGAIFAVLLGFIIFNVWFATTNMETTVGTIFSVVAYSWEFVDSALLLPVTLQGWSRLSEIMDRINRTKKPVA